MILSFSTHLKGKPTMFTNKIVKTMWQHYSLQMKYLALSRKLPEYYVFEDLTIFQEEKLKPKLHSIREDKKGRWKTNTMIDFFIYTRQKNMFRFAPFIPVVSIQKIEIIYDKNFGKSIFPTIIIDGNKLHPEKVDELAQNDGFDTVEEFLQFFNKDFKGKIIHWTDFNY